MDSTDIITPLAETIGILGKEWNDAGRTEEACRQFEDRLRALRIFVGNMSGCEFTKVVLCNHLASIKMWTSEHYESKRSNRTVEANAARG